MIETNDLVQDIQHSLENEMPADIRDILDRCYDVLEQLRQAAKGVETTDCDK